MTKKNPRQTNDAADDPFDPNNGTTENQSEQTDDVKQSVGMTVPKCPRCGKQCSVADAGLVYLFTCGCGFEMRGPPNLKMTKRYQDQQNRQHEQHTVRDYQR